MTRTRPPRVTYLRSNPLFCDRKSRRRFTTLRRGPQVPGD
nr:MAG TPA: hypothetical protein [Caudoviricetes sp.]